jgi:hypothetical protein
MTRCNTVWRETASALIASRMGRYLHYVYDLWPHRWRQTASGDMIVIRYADDSAPRGGLAKRGRADGVIPEAGPRVAEAGWHTPAEIGPAGREHNTTARRGG